MKSLDNNFLKLEFMEEFFTIFDHSLMSVHSKSQLVASNPGLYNNSVYSEHLMRSVAPSNNSSFPISVYQSNNSSN